MMDWVAGAVASAKTMGDIAKSLLTIRDESVIKARVFELNSTLMEMQQQIMQAQREQMTLLDEVADLKKKLRDSQEKSKTLERYELVNVGAGKVIYLLKPEFAAEEPSHFCCTKCYGNGKRSIMKGRIVQDSDWMKFICPECDSSVGIENKYIPGSMLRGD